MGLTSVLSASRRCRTARSAPLNSFRRHEPRLRRPAGHEPQTEVQRELEKAESRIQLPMPVSVMLAATTCTRPQPRSAKTTRWCVSRTCRCGTCPSRRPVTRNAGQAGSGQVRPEQIHPRSGLVRVPPTIGLQGGLGGLLVAVPPQYTSQTCPRCDRVSAANRATRGLVQVYGLCL